MMLPKTLRPFEHAVLEHQQALFQQDDVRRLLRDIRRRVDRNADVGSLQRRRVVDAVAEKADDMAVAAAARAMTRAFCAGDSLAKTVCFGRLRELSSFMPSTSAPSSEPSICETDVLADLARHHAHCRRSES